MSTLLEVDDLRGHFRHPDGDIEALHGVSFGLRRNTLTAIVGETGSGKSLTAMTVLGIQPRSFVVSNGSIRFDGTDLLGAGDKDMRRIRGARIAMVFQDARAALNPVFPVGGQIADVCRLHTRTNRRDAEAAAIAALERVQIPEPARRARQYPHEFSGGMAQRVMIAMALVCAPELLILDEPTTGLDVTIQAEIMSLIVRLTRESGLTACLITHDLGVVAETCEEVVVMRDGGVVETGSCESVFVRPRADYTRALLEASRLVEGEAA